MNKLFSWVSTHKLAVVLLLAIGYMLWKQSNGFYPNVRDEVAMSSSYLAPEPMLKSTGGVGGGFTSDRMILPPSGGEGISQSPDRMVTTDTWLSLVTKNVSETLIKIEDTAKNAGGFMLNSSLTVPEGASNGSISIRVPTEKRSEVLATIRSFGVKVVDENVSGTDITAQYEDIEAQLAILNSTKAKFEAIQQRATTVQEMLEVQRELSNLQSQIDSYKGRQSYLEKTASLSLIAVYLSTDELALPYTPDDSWRPAVVFKEAVRGLILTARGAIDKLIWVAVYAPIWLPLLLIALWVKKRKMSAQ